MEIEINGIKLLNDMEKKIANELLNEYYPKIQRMIKNELSLRIIIKEYEKKELEKDMKKKYSLNIEAVTPGKTFRAKAFDWNFARTIHKLLNKVMTEIEHTFHNSEQK